MGSLFKGRKITTLNFCQCQSASSGRYLVSKIRISAQLHKQVFLHKHSLFYPVKLPRQPNTLLANAGRFRRELCLPSTHKPRYQTLAAPHNNILYIWMMHSTSSLCHSHWKPEWISIAFFSLEQESFQSHLNLLISSLQATHKTEALAHMCWCWSVMLADRQCNGQKKTRAYGNIIKFPIPAKQAIRYAILANGMVNQLYSTDGFFLNKAP